MPALQFLGVLMLLVIRIDKGAVFVIFDRAAANFLVLQLLLF
jgi:hypothetical protein